MAEESDDAIINDLVPKTFQIAKWHQKSIDKLNEIKVLHAAGLDTQRIVAQTLPISSRGKAFERYEKWAKMMIRKIETIQKQHAKQ